MKKLIFIPLFLVVMFANAQFKLGGVIGINNSSFSGRDAIGSTSYTGFQIGVISELKAPKTLGVELDILFSTKGSSHKINPTNVNLAYIDIPVVMKLYMMKILSLQLGAQYSILTSASIGSQDVKNEINSKDFAIVFGAGVDVNRIHFSFRYNVGLFKIDVYQSEVYNDVLSLSLGVWLKK